MLQVVGEFVFVQMNEANSASLPVLSVYFLLIVLKEGQGVPLSFML